MFTLLLFITDSTGFYFHPNGPAFLFTGITKIVIHVRLMFPQACILPAASLLEGGGAYKSWGPLPLNHCQYYPSPRSPPTHTLFMYITLATGCCANRPLFPQPRIMLSPCTPYYPETPDKISDNFWTITIHKGILIFRQCLTYQALSTGHKFRIRYLREDLPIPLHH